MNIDFAKQKEEYYKAILSDVYIEPDFQSKKVACKVCKEYFYYINSKEELLKLIEETVKENENFPMEMIKLMGRFYYPGADLISFHEKEGICSCCYVNKPKYSFRKIIKKLFKM